MGNYAKNAVSGVFLWLVSLPMSMGIALACNLPPISGLVAAAIGGIIVGILSPSKISVTAPAAGLIIITATALKGLGTKELLFISISLAGVFQIIFSLFRLGFLAGYFPTVVVRGMMASIGAIVFIKQIGFLLLSGHEVGLNSLSLFTADFSSWDDVYKGINWSNLILLIPAIIIGVGHLLSGKKFQTSNIQFLCVLSCIVFYVFLMMVNHDVLKDMSHLGALSVTSIFKSDLKGAIFAASFQQWEHVLYYSMMLFFICSLESVLTLNASEKIDPHRAQCSKDRELFAQGAGNIVSGFLGGLPITTVLARTTLNIKSGANSRGATITQGVLIVFSIILLHKQFGLIPLPIVALVMMFVGYQLCSLEVLKQGMSQGFERSSVFLFTFLGIVFKGIEVGIFIGVLLSFFYVLKKHSQTKLNIYNENNSATETFKIILPENLTFLNVPSLVSELSEIPKGAKLVIDARYVNFLDQEVIELLDDFSKVSAKERGIAVNLLGFKENYELKDKIEFINVPTVETLARLTPLQAIKILMEGNVRFINDVSVHRHTKTEIDQTKEQQSPFAAIVGCIDSRVPVETVFDVGFGEVFCARVAGNVSNIDIVASLEYAINVVGSKAIVVLGHTECGAVKAACDKFTGGNITPLLAKISPSLLLAQSKNPQNYVSAVTQINIANTILSCYSSSQGIKEKIISEEVLMVGGVYHVSSGKVIFYDYANILKELSTGKDGELHHLINSMSSIAKIFKFEEPSI